MPIIKKKDIEAKVFMEGVEMCREYFKTEKITFGSSYLLPGEEGETDWGHKDSEEVFYIARGNVLLKENDEIAYEMFEGDAALILPGTPHTLKNIGIEPALITWSLAPSEKCN